jgi:hypothetical protein
LQKRLEQINLIAFGSLGLVIAEMAIIRIIVNDSPYGDYPFRHSPETFVIAGLGLAALCCKHKLYGFPMFMIAANLVELPWMMYSPFWNSLQLVALVFGYAISRPSFKSLGWVVAVVAINQPGSLPQYIPALYHVYYQFFIFHHIAEIATFVMFLFNVKSFKTLWDKAA